jgi:hypothetical protein
MPPQALLGLEKHGNMSLVFGGKWLDIDWREADIEKYAIRFDRTVFNQTQDKAVCPWVIP